MFLFDIVCLDLPEIIFIVYFFLPFILLCGIFHFYIVGWSEKNFFLKSKKIPN